jgi:hypothetical protein
MQSILGALLTAGYASAIGKSIASSPNASSISKTTQDQLQQSFAGAENIAKLYPSQSTQIINAAKSAFLDGADWAYAAGVIAVLLGAVLVYFAFPRNDDEKRLLAQYAEEDEPETAASSDTPAQAG